MSYIDQTISDSTLSTSGLYVVGPQPAARPGVFCSKPFEVKHLKTKVKSGFATVEQKSELVALELIMNCSFTDRFNGLMVPIGHKILVKADGYAQSWARQVLEYEGQEFIIVPEDAVIGWI